MLPVLDGVFKAVQGKTPNINRTAFVCVQHLLYTTIDIFERLIELGAKPENIFLIGKQYSTCSGVVKKASQMGIQVQPCTPLMALGNYKEVFNQDIEHLWYTVRQHLMRNHHTIDKLIVLDDGGRCFKMIPKDILKSLHVVAIEQTTAGLTELNSVNPYEVVYIDIAKSASKSLEVNMISKAVLSKIGNQLPSPRSKPKFGVVGIGAIGSALVKRLVLLGYNLKLYDPNAKKIKENVELSSYEKTPSDSPKISTLRRIFSKGLIDKHPTPGSIEWIDTLEDLFEQSDYIFGCTGIDFTKGHDYEILLKGRKHLISCSSEDKEFLSILQLIQKDQPNNSWNPLEDVCYAFNKNSRVHLVKGGFPCNFDHSGTSVPGEDIQLTRSLILGGLIQAATSYSSYKLNRIRGTIMLDPSMQRFIVQKWAKSQNVRNPKIPKFSDLHWIIQHSNGQYHQLPTFSSLFEEEHEKEVRRVS